MYPCVFLLSWVCVPLLHTMNQYGVELQNTASSQIDLGLTPALLLDGCVTLSQLLDFLIPLFLHL